MASKEENTDQGSFKDLLEKFLHEMGSDEAQTSKRDRAAALLMLYTGARAGELTQLRVEDLGR